MKYTFKCKHMSYNFFLVPFTAEHMSPRYVEWFHDLEVTKYNSHGLFPYTRQQQQDFKRDIEKATDKIMWAIEIEIPTSYGTSPYYNKHIGNCVLQKIDYINRSAEFAIVIGDKSYWGYGLCTKVLDLLLQHAFMKLGLNRVWSGTADTNIAMKKAMLTNNMSQEGCFKEGVFLNGKFTDVCSYGILASVYFENAIKKNETDLSKIKGYVLTDEMKLDIKNRIEEWEKGRNVK